MKVFRVGEKVRWESQAGGCTKTKVGMIVEGVPAKCSPFSTKAYLEHLGSRSNIDRRTMARSTESYLVLVGTALYWPLVSKMERVP